MADPVIGGLGRVSLISLFQTCTSAYDVFVRSARDLGKDYYRISVHLSIERQKLRLWGQYLGISQSQQCRLLQAETQQTQKTVVAMLEAIKTLLEEIRVIMYRYDSRIGETSGNQDPMGVDSSLELNPNDLNLEGVDIQSSPALHAARVTRRETETFVKSSTSRLRKIKWALGDSTKLNKLVEDLRLINENLWVALPVNKWLALAKGLPSLVLPDIIDSGMLREVENSARDGTTTELLNACADLRRVALVAEKREDPAFGEYLRWSSESVTEKKLFGETDERVTGPRAIASIQGQDGIARPVVIEWRFVDREFTEDQKQVIRSRIKALAVLLSSTKSAELGLLRCVGFFKDDHPFGEKYGLLLEIPRTEIQQPTLSPQMSGPSSRATHPCSLYEYINITSHAPPLLGDRFRIAATLCNILLQVHASNWLHKAIRPSNILFLDKNSDAPNAAVLRSTQPYLVGFDFSRPDHPTAESLEQPRDKSGNAYLHPALWTSRTGNTRPRFRKEFDIFALGVVLLEIGNWKLAERANEKSGGKHLANSQAWKAFLLENAKYLGYRCGKIYQDVVETCLNGPFVENSGMELEFEPGMDVLDIKRSFLFDVVYQLAKCNV